MRINVELLSGESGAALWMDRLDADVTDRSGQQEEIGGWLSDAAARALVVAEAARSARERPDEPDALDLVLQARAVVAEPASARRWKEAQALFERAVRLDPGSVPALAGLANAIISQATEMGEPLGATDIGRAEELTEAAAAIAPTDPMVVWDRAYLFRVEQRWPEAEAAFEHLLNMYPHITNGVFMLGVCRLQLGRADEAIPLFSKAIRVSPRFPSIWSRYHRMAQALLLSGRYDEAPLWYQRALTADPQLSAGNRADKHYYMASAYALAGHVEKAREQVDEGMSLWPYATARSAMAVFVSNDAFAEQVERVREGLRLAGLRDHVDEDQDFGIGPVSDLQSRLVGETPLTVPGATTIRTMELGALLGSGKLVVIDASEGNRSLPGAILLPEAGRGGSLQDAMQDRLGLFMRRLTGGDLTAQIVTLGINAERWTGYNLALRLIALGYRHVFWYRGGREAWEVAGLHLTRSPPVLLSIR
jgi:tetratricopeptide (TPR) repeat protein